MSPCGDLRLPVRERLLIIYCLMSITQKRERCESITYLRQAYTDDYLSDERDKANFVYINTNLNQLIIIPKLK